MCFPFQPEFQFSFLFSFPEINHEEQYRARKQAADPPVRRLLTRAVLFFAIDLCCFKASSQATVKTP